MGKIAYIIRTAGDPALCKSVGEVFESPELRKLKMENELLRREIQALRRMELVSLRREIDAMFYGRKAFRAIRKAAWRAAGFVAKRCRGAVATYRIFEGMCKNEADS